MKKIFLITTFIFIFTLALFHDVSFAHGMTEDTAIVSDGHTVREEAGGWSSPFGSNQSNNSMMNFGFTPFGGFSWIFMILWWGLIISGIVVLIKWLMSQSHGPHNHKMSALENLKERYSKGEVDKKEFDEKKKDLS